MSGYCAPSRRPMSTTLLVYGVGQQELPPVRAKCWDMEFGQMPACSTILVNRILPTGPGGEDVGYFARVVMCDGTRNLRSRTLVERSYVSWTWWKGVHA